MNGETIAPGMKKVNLEKGKYSLGGDLFELETKKKYERIT